MRTKNLFKSGLCLVILLLVVMQARIQVNAVDISPSSINGTGAFLMDATTGEELWSKNPDTKLAPASLTKLMTLYLVYDAMDTGAFSLSSRVPIDAEISTFSINGYYSNVPLSTTSTYTVDELIDSVVIVSACGSTRALARLACGTEKAAVEKMNEKARELGIDCSYVDCYGGSSQNRVTARGMAILVYNLLKDHPDLLRHTSKASFYFHGYTYYNTNTFVTGKYKCNGTVDGVKTGSASFAGCCLATTAYTQYGRVISVVLNAYSTDIRAKDTQKILNAGLQELQNRAAAGWQYAQPETVNLCLNGIDAQLPTYVLNDTAYVRLADVALLLQDTSGAFSWEEGETVEILKNTVYTGVAGTALPEGTVAMEPYGKTVSGMEDVTLYQVQGAVFVPLQRLLNLLGLTTYEDAGVLQIVTEDYVEPFVDVLQRRYYADSVSWAVEHQIAKGMTEITFQPELSCTRGHVITFLWRAAGSPEPESTEHPFVDVDASRFYYKAMLWGVEQGIVQGMTENTFQPEGLCTRGQVVTFLYRYEALLLEEAEPEEPEAGEAPEETGDTMEPEAGEASEETGDTMEPEAGEASEETGDTMEPEAGEAPEEAEDTGEPGETEPSEDGVESDGPEEPESPFTDLSPNRYYYDSVRWAAENQIAQGMTDTTFEPEGLCTRGQVVTFLYRYMNRTAA